MPGPGRAECTDDLRWTEVNRVGQVGRGGQSEAQGGAGRSTVWVPLSGPPDQVCFLDIHWVHWVRKHVSKLFALVYVPVYDGTEGG